VDEHRLLDGGRTSGVARSERVQHPGGGATITFSSALGHPRPDRVLTGVAELDGELRWTSVSASCDGQVVSLTPASQAEIEIAGVPCLYGITALRLLRAGIRPGETRKVSLQRIDGDMRESRIYASVTWLGGQAWRIDAPQERTWLQVRPNGAVRVVEGVAELV
jgi:hypothetical protein